MDFFDAVDSRHSIRKFSGRGVEEEKLQKLLEACNKAPSAGNVQAYRIFVVKSREKRAALAAAKGREFVSQAPVVLVFCANPTESEEKFGERGAFYSIQDATIAASYCQLAATALGLASVWLGSFDEEAVLEAVGEKGLKPIAIIPVGYPDEGPEIKGRKPLGDLIKEL